MFRLGSITFTALWLITGNINPASAQSDAGAAFIGAVMGAIIGHLATQPPQTVQPPAYAPQPAQQPANVYPPDPRVQQQIDEERQRAAADAADRVKHRQQADADAKAKQQQATLKAQVAAKAKADADDRARQGATTKLRTDPVLLSVLGADPRDVTALVVGKDTANVIRNMEGHPVFQSAPTACLPFGSLASQSDSPEWRFLASVTHTIVQKGGLVANEPSLMATVCVANEFGRYDLVLFSGAQVANGTLEVLSPLVDTLRQRQFVSLGTFTVADFLAGEAAKAAAAKAEAAKQAAERDEARAGFQTRDATTISGIHLESPAAVVCLMASDADGVRYILKRSDSPFANLVTATSVIRAASSADAIFIALKKRDCVAAIGPAGALRDVVTALVRDEVQVSVDSGLVDPARLANWKVLAEKDLITAQEQQAASLAERRRLDTVQAAEEDRRRTLAAEEQKHDEAARREVIEGMRTQVASKATAVVDGLATQANSHVSIVRDEVRDKRSPTKQVLSSFQPWATWVEAQIKSGWEFSAVNATVEDYGRAQWSARVEAKPRTIEAISVRVELPMLNRAIGEKTTSCWDFVWINDEEFGFRRNPIAVTCEEYKPAFGAWAEQNAFASQWKLLPNGE